MSESSPLKCTFCEKGSDVVQRLIAGPKVYICDECVDLCTMIIGYHRYIETMKPVVLGKIVPLPASPETSGEQQR